MDEKRKKMFVLIVKSFSWCPLRGTGPLPRFLPSCSWYYFALQNWSMMVGGHPLLAKVFFIACVYVQGFLCILLWNYFIASTKSYILIVQYRKQAAYSYTMDYRCKTLGDWTLNFWEHAPLHSGHHLYNPTSLLCWEEASRNMLANT